MASNDPSLIVKVAANISALQADMATAAASVKNIESAVTTANSASTSWAGSLNELGHSWVARIAEGELLRDAVREVLSAMKEMVEFLPELALHGAVVGDVEEAFRHLATEAGHTSEVLLGTLRSGTRGTIDDFELMKRVNQDLAAGLNLTDQQFGLLAQGAFALAKATGGDVKTALDSMNDAMITGRTRAVALLTGKIDLKVAEETFAASLGTTADHLSAEGKLEADREAILKAVAAGLARVGEQTDSLDAKVQQAKVAWTNFTDQLGVAIAHSPVLAAAFDSAKASLTAAFGPDQTELVKTIALAVDDVAIKVVDFGIAAGLVAGEVVQAWNLIKVPILGVETLITGLVDVVGEAYLAADKLALKLHLVDPSETAAIQENVQALRAMTVSLAEQTAEAARAATGDSALGHAIDTTNGMLLNMRDSMIAAQASTKGSTDAATAFVGPLQAVGGAIQANGAYTRETAADLKAYDAILKEMDKVTFTLAMEHEKQWREEQLTRAKQVNAAVLAELDARVKLNATYGLSVDGEMKVTSAAETYRIALEKLHITRQEGISQAAQEQLLTDAYTKALYDEAVAQDKANAALAQVPPATAAADQSVKQFTNTLVLGITNLDQLNAALSDFYDQFTGNNGSVGTPGVGSVGTMGAQGMPRVAGASQFRADGGPVSAGAPYVVGERGPELFVPNAAGAIVPNGAGAGGTQVIQLVVDGRVLTSIVNDHNTRSMRQSRQFPAS